VPSRPLEVGTAYRSLEGVKNTQQPHAQVSMDRRGFLKALGGATAGLLAAAALPSVPGAEAAAATSPAAPAGIVAGDIVVPQIRGLQYLVTNAGTYMGINRSDYAPFRAGDMIDVYDASMTVKKASGRITDRNTISLT
jgi:hypothetical protein